MVGPFKELLQTLWQHLVSFMRWSAGVGEFQGRTGGNKQIGQEAQLCPELSAEVHQAV